jgi:tryptophanyl-tRNA synthetase
VHQAADILFCKGNLVPVGKDNLPHVEMTRVIARRFNERYGDVFPVPDALITSTPEVPGLDGRKMSKSYGNAIALSMTPDETVAVIRQTRTDQDRRISFDPEDRPGVSALLSTAALCRGVEPAELADEIGDGGSSALKAMTATAVNDFLEPLRVRRQAFAKDEDLVRAILRHGNEAANTSAESTLAQVREAMGTIY